MVVVVEGYGNKSAEAAAFTASRRRDDHPIPRSDVRMPGFKPKDMVGQPHRLAFALQDAGWYLRQDIVWHKPNPMPESTKDRCTKAHEFMFLLAKRRRYYFDHEAIKEPVSANTHARLAQDLERQIGSTRANGGSRAERPMKACVPSGWATGTDRKHDEVEGRYSQYRGNGVGFGYADEKPKPRTVGVAVEEGAYGDGKSERLGCLRRRALGAMVDAQEVGAGPAMKRSTAMKRTGFKGAADEILRRSGLNRPSPLLSLLQGRDPDRVRSTPTAVPERFRTATPANDAVVAIPKGEKAKPGKGAPNAEERAWMDWIVSYGCIACRIDGHGFTPPAVHHILRGGRRMGHLFTLPLCDPGHHQGGEARGVISRHPWKARFEARYGTELQLLADLQGTMRRTMGSPLNR